MTTPFDPLVGDAVLSGGQGSNTLPNGQYDIYNLGALWDKTLYLGNDTHTQTGPYAGTDVLKQGQNSSQSVTSPVTSTPFDYMQEFASWSVTNPDQYAALQQQLYSAGFYGSKKPRLGVWTTGDAKAMKEAITGYLQVVNPGTPHPLTLSDYLDHASQQSQKDQSAAALAAPIPVTDPAAIRQAAQAAFQAATGKGASDAQLNAFVAQFQSAQQTAQTTATGAVSAPDLSSQAMEYAQQQDPSAYQGHQRQSFVNTLVNMFAPSGSQRPNMTPVASVGGGV